MFVAFFGTENMDETHHKVLSKCQSIISSSKGSKNINGHDLNSYTVFINNNILFNFKLEQKNKTFVYKAPLSDIEPDAELFEFPLLFDELV